MVRLNWRYRFTLVKTTTPSKLTQEQGDYATTVSAKVTNKDVGGTTRQSDV